MFETLKAENWISIAGVLVAALLALKAMSEYRISIAERRRSLRWQQAEMARQIIEAIRQNDYSASALKMLDWSGVEYTKPDGEKTSKFNAEQRRNMLRVENAIFNGTFEKDAPFIRDCFDRMLEDCCLIEQYIANGLVRVEDISPYFSHYMKLASSAQEAPVLDRFALSYGYDDFFNFRNRMTGSVGHG